LLSYLYTYSSLCFCKTEQSRRCPLCSQRINEYLIHHIRSKFDYQKHYLTPLRTSPPPLQSRTRPHARREEGVRRDGEQRERPWGRRARRDAEDRDETNDLERAIARRRWVYDHGLYAKVSFCLPTFTIIILFFLVTSTHYLPGWNGGNII
jgi:hypothetical protein